MPMLNGIVDRGAVLSCLLNALASAPRTIDKAKEPRNEEGRRSR